VLELSHHVQTQNLSQFLLQSFLLLPPHFQIRMMYNHQKQPLIREKESITNILQCEKQLPILAIQIPLCS
jgi:hypothetical protein